MTGCTHDHPSMTHGALVQMTQAAHLPGWMVETIQGAQRVHEDYERGFLEAFLAVSLEALGSRVSADGLAKALNRLPMTWYVGETPGCAVDHTRPMAGVEGILQACGREGFPHPSDPSSPVDQQRHPQWIGQIYEASLPRDHRKHHGMFYTPADTVQAMAEGLFAKTPTIPGRTPVVVADFAAGTGALLDPDVLRSIQRRHPDSPVVVVAVEPDPVASWVGLVQWLWNWLPVAAAGEPLPHLVWVTADALSLYGGTLQEEGGVENSSASLLPWDPHRVDTWSQPGWVHYCLGNPPYIGEKGHKALFEETLRAYPQWQPFYRGRMDYAYFFMALAMEKLAPKGRMSLITTRYWLTADSATTLREAFLTHCGVESLTESHTDEPVFDDAVGQHNVIVTAHRAASRLACQAQTIQWQSGEAELYTVTQGTWMDPPGPGQPWLRFTSPQQEARLRYLKNSPGLVRLEEVFDDTQGVISGADRLTAHHLKRFPGLSGDLTVGQGIFCFTPEEVGLLVWPDAVKAQWLFPFVKQAHVSPYGLNVPVSGLPKLLYLSGKESEPIPPCILDHLQRFRPILEQRREVTTGQLPWYALHWSRRYEILHPPSLATSRRGLRNTFFLSPHGVLANSDMTLLTLKAGLDPRCLPFYLGVLNSRWLDEWQSVYGKPKGRIREYFSTPVRQIPLPPPPDQWEAPEIQGVMEAVEALMTLSVDRREWERWNREPGKGSQDVPTDLIPSWAEHQAQLDHAVGQILGLVTI